MFGISEATYKELIQLLVQAAVLGLVGLMATLVPVLRKWAVSAAQARCAELSLAERGFMRMLVVESVALAERMGNVAFAGPGANMTGSDKKQLAVAYVTRGLKSVGIRVDAAMVDVAIEAFLAEAKGALEDVKTPTGA